MTVQHIKKSLGIFLLGTCVWLGATYLLSR